MKSTITNPNQLGFDALLIDADEANRQGAFEKEYGHLPKTMNEALPFFRSLIEKHHAAMLAADIEQVMTLRNEAHKLALRLNNGEPGILAGPDAPGCTLARLTLAEEETVPLWGQGGIFTISASEMRVRIEMDGVFGIGAPYSPWLNFCVRAVDWHKPFLSETGFRSFLGIHADLVPGLTPDAFAVKVIEGHVRSQLKGKLRPIESRYHPVCAGRTQEGLP